MRSSGIMAIAYSRLKTHLGISGGNTHLYDLVQQLAQPEDWYLKRFHVDAIDLGRAFTQRDSWQPWTLPDGSPALAPAWFQPQKKDGGLWAYDKEGTLIGRMPAGCLYVEQACWPLSHENGVDELENLPAKMSKVVWAALPTAPFDQTLTDERLDEISQVASETCATTEYAISVALGCNLLEWSQFLFGMENAYMYMAGEKQKFAYFLDQLADLHMASLSRILPKLRGSFQVLVLGDDLGMQKGPQISRKMYRELFFPRHKRIYEHAKKLSGAHIFLHSCGGIYELMPDLIEAGVEIFNPVQTNCHNMEPERLKREFGRDVTFWGGGCDTRDVLPNGTPDQVRDDVRRRMEIFAPGGGFVWAQVHNIMADIPPANIEAMLEAAAEYGVY